MRLVKEQRGELCPVPAQPDHDVVLQPVGTEKGTSLISVLQYANIRDAQRGRKSIGGGSWSSRLRLSAGRTKRGLKAELLGNATRPAVLAKRPAPQNAAADGRQFALGLRLLHPPRPVPRGLHRQSLRISRSAASAWQRRHRLDHRHCSTSSTIPARNGLRSMYRATVRRCSSDCTGNDLERPW